MSDLVSGYVAYKSTTGLVKGTQKTIDNGLIGALILIFIIISPYIQYLTSTVSTKGVLTLKQMSAYAIQVNRLLRYKLYAWIMIFASFPLTYYLIVLIKSSTHSQWNGFWFGTFGMFFINILIFLVWRFIILDKEVSRKEEFDSFISNLFDMIEPNKQVIAQVIAQNGRDSELFTQRLNAEVDVIIEKISNQYTFSYDTLQILEKDITQMLGGSVGDRVSSIDTTVERNLNSDTEKTHILTKIIYAVIGLYVAFHAISIINALLR